MDATHGKDVEFGDKQSDSDPPSRTKPIFIYHQWCACAPLAWQSAADRRLETRRAARHRQAQRPLSFGLIKRPPGKTACLA